MLRKGGFLRSIFPKNKEANKVAIAKVTTKKDLAQDKKIKRLTTFMKHQELKRYDASNNTQAFSRTEFVQNLSNVAQGDDINNRQGDKILPKTLHLNFYTPEGVANRYPKRIMVVQDREQDGVDPTFSQIVEAYVAGSSEMIAHPMFTNRKRFKILYDEVFIPATTGNIVQGSDNGVKTFHRKLKFRLKSPILYDAAAGADGSNRENNIYLIGISDTTTSNTDSINWWSRLTYTDN